MTSLVLGRRPAPALQSRMSTGPDGAPSAGAGNGGLGPRSERVLRKTVRGWRGKLGGHECPDRWLFDPGEARSRKKSRRADPLASVAVAPAAWAGEASAQEGFAGEHGA